MSNQHRDHRSLSELQALADALATRLDRSVAVDNPALELLCASAHHGPIDARRIDAIIHRTPPLEPVPWLHEQGIASATQPVRIPANETFEMLPRVCVPIRSEGRLNGYLWLFDTPVLDDQEIAIAIAIAAEMAPLLSTRDDDIRDRAAALATLARRAIDTDEVSDAVDEASEAGLLPSEGEFRVFRFTVGTTRTLDGSGGGLDPLASLAARERPVRSFLIADEPGGAVIVARTMTRSLDDVLRTIHRIGRAAGARAIHIGSAAAPLAADLPQAAVRARFAARIDAIEPGPSSHRMWETLGSWRVLSGLPLSAATVGVVSDDARLLIDRGSLEQRSTALAYLDEARDVRRTCERLRIHRTTLYYRLDRVRELLGADAIDDGWRALALHAALRLHTTLERRERENQATAD